MVPRARACRFSSVTSRGRPAKIGASACSSPRTALSIGTTSYCTPSEFGGAGGIVEGGLRREPIGQHDATDATCSERIGRQRRHQRRVDAARKPEHDPLEAVLVDIVAQAQHAGEIVGPVALFDRNDRSVDAAPAIAGALPSQGLDGFTKVRELEGERAIGVQAERRAVEHKLVLAADLVHIDERQIAFGDARHGDVESNLVLVAGIRRAVGHDHQLGTGLGEAFDHVLVVAPFGPDVLADGNAEAHTAEIDRPGRRPRREDAALVEHAIVRQVHFETHGGDGAAVEQAAGVMELALLDPRRADQQRRAAIAGLARKLLDLHPASRLEGGLEHEILLRIAREEKFRQSHQIRTLARGLGTRAPGLVGVAGNVAHGRIELRNRDRQVVGQTGIHGDKV